MQVLAYAKRQSNDENEKKDNFCMKSKTDPGF
jgi:hypothetical protein